MLPRHLLLICRRDDVIPDVDENIGDRFIGPDVLRQRGRKRGVAPVSVEGDAAGLGREADQGADGRLDGGQAARKLGAPRAEDACEIACQRVVAAGVEKNDVGLRIALHGALDEIEADHLEVERPLGQELGVDGHEIVLAADLEPVTAVEENADRGAVERSQEFAERAIHAGFVEVDAEDDVKSQGLELARDVLGVVLRVLEGGGILVGRVANDEGNALLCCNSLAGPHCSKNGDRNQP